MVFKIYRVIDKCFKLRINFRKMFHLTFGKQPFKNVCKFVYYFQTSFQRRSLMFFFPLIKVLIKNSSDIRVILSDWFLYAYFISHFIVRVKKIFTSVILQSYSLYIQIYISIHITIYIPLYSLVQSKKGFFIFQRNRKLFFYIKWYNCLIYSFCYTKKRCLRFIPK